MSRIACLAVVTFLAAACGTGGTATVTVPASSDSGGASSTTTESPAKLLAAYIGAMHKAEGQWNHAQSAWTKALGHNLPQPHSEGA